MIRRLRRLSLVIAVCVLMVGVFVGPASAGGDSGKKAAEGAFHSIGTGSAALEFGPAALANPQARDNFDSVRIFAYQGSQSEGQVYCGEVWNVIVNVDFQPYREWFEGTYVTHSVDGAPPVVAEDVTPVRYFGALGFLTRVHGTFLAPGTLSEGTHTIGATFVNPFYGTFPLDPVTIEVDNSTC